MCNTKKDRFPEAVSARYFIIIDNRPSRYWIWGSRNAEQNITVVFPEWIADSFFFDRLTDYEDREVEIFKKYRELMDFEFPDSSITEYAQVGDEKWLMCPKCIDAWECDNNKDALVRCSLCETIYNNPRYKNEWPHLPLQE